MKIGIMQPYFFPYVGYFALIQAVDKFVLYDDVAYIKRGWVNRNRINIGNDAHYISVPVANASQDDLIKEVRIFNFGHFKEEFFKTLQLNYSKALYYRDTLEMLREIFANDYEFINQLNTTSLIRVCEYLEINTEMLVSSDIPKNTELRAEAKILDICKILRGDIYINAIGGQDLYTKENFLKENITLNFIKMNEIIYPQGKGEFVPNLSIIDVLMWNSKEAAKQMLQEYTLI
jgi:hypothetical protein